MKQVKVEVVFFVEDSENKETVHKTLKSELENFVSKSNLYNVGLLWQRHIIIWNEGK